MNMETIKPALSLPLSPLAIPHDAATPIVFVGGCQVSKCKASEAGGRPDYREQPVPRSPPAIWELIRVALAIFASIT